MESRLAFPIFLGVMFLALASQSSALEMTYYDIDADIMSSMNVNFQITMKTNGSMASMNYDLDFNVENLTAESASGTSRCRLQKAGTGSRISCDFYGMDAQENTIKMAFMTRDVVKRVGDEYEFRAALPVSMPVKRMIATVRLPQKSTLAKDVANESFFPPDGRVITDGKRLIVYWLREEGLSQNDNLGFSILFDVAGAGGTMWDMTIIAMVLLIVAAMAVIAIYMRRGSPAEKPEVKVLPLLNRDEKRIVDIIAKNRGTARQRDIVKEADFSKAKVSRLIKSLKERGVVDTEAISGRENKVILKIKGIDAG